MSAWVAEQVAMATMDNKSAETILSAVAKMTASLNADFRERELVEARAIERSITAAQDAIRRHEALGRGAAADSTRPSTGRTRVTDVA